MRPRLITSENAERRVRFLADDWNELPLTGRMKTPLGRTEPFVVDFRD